MEKITGIYKISSPNNRIYIGQSIDIKSRFNDYLKYNCKKQLLLYNSLKKYGVNKHKFGILHQCSINELNDLEIYYIELYQCFNSKFGMNIRGGGCSGGKLSEETKKKIGLKSVGRMVMLGKHHSQSAKDKISASNKGKIAANRRALVDIKTGIIYSCKKEAAEAIGMKERTLKAMLRGQNPNKTNIRYNTTAGYIKLMDVDILGTTSPISSLSI